MEGNAIGINRRLPLAIFLAFSNPEYPLYKDTFSSCLTIIICETLEYLFDFCLFGFVSSNKFNPDNSQGLFVSKISWVDLLFTLQVLDLVDLLRLCLLLGLRIEILHISRLLLHTFHLLRTSVAGLIVDLERLLQNITSFLLLVGWAEED